MKNICRICLRLDKELRVVSNVLSEYHDELCDYKMDTLDPQYCNECRHLLTKMYKFKEKCILAVKILQEWKQKNSDGKKLKDLHTFLPKSSIGMWIENNVNNATFTFIETERVPVLCIDGGFIKTSAVNQKQETDVQLKQNRRRDLVLMKKDDIEKSKILMQNDGKFVYIDAATSEGMNIKLQNNEINTEAINVELQTHNKTKNTNNTKEKVNTSEDKAKKSKEIKSSNDNIRDIDYSVMECNDSDGACSIKSIDVSIDHSYTTAEKGSLDESKKKKVKMVKTRKRPKRKSMKFDTKSLQVVAKSFSGELVKSIDLQTLKQECDVKSKATFCVERLKAEMMLKFAEIESTVSDEIDGHFLIKCLGTKVKEATLNRLWSYVRNNLLFSESCLNLLRSLQTRLKNDQQYESIFEIEYLNTEEEMREEFEKRKSYEGYLNAEFKCEICYQGFKYPKTLENHKAVHDESSGDHACSICMIRYKQRGSLIDHKNVAHSNVYKCKMCRMVTYYRHCMINHYEQHLGKKYSCMPCGLTYKSRSAYFNHLSTYHYVAEHLCIACGRAFRTAASLKYHKKRKHEGDPENLNIGGSDARCEQCDVTFPSPEIYLQHCRAMHKQRRRIFGSRCDSKLYPKLKRNDKKPSGLRKIPVMTCRVCDATGSSYGWLVQHFNTVHPDVDMDPLYADKKPHLCHICGKRLSNLQTLLEHINVHLNVQRHQCSTCGKWFRRYAHLHFHRLMHQPPSLVCSQCGKKFRSPSNLRAHMRVHIGIRRYKCRICGKGFLHQSAVNEHVRGVHNHIRRVKNKKKPTAKTINKTEEFIHSSPLTGSKSEATEENVAEVKVVYMVDAVEGGSEAREESNEVVKEGSEAREEGNEVVEECNVEAMEERRSEAQKSRKATKQSDKEEKSKNADEMQVEYYEEVLEEGYDETIEECSEEEKNNNCYEIQEDYYEEVLEEDYDETTEQCIAEAKNRNSDETQEDSDEVLEECLEEFLEEELYDEET